MKRRTKAIVSIIIVSVVSSVLVLSQSLPPVGQNGSGNLALHPDDLSRYDGVPFSELEKSRHVYVMAALAAEAVPERNCHKFGGNEVQSLPAELRDAMDESSRYASTHTPHEGFYSQEGWETDPETALELLDTYDFAAEAIPTYDRINMLHNTQYDFECFFEVNSQQFRVNVFFTGVNDFPGKTVFVNFTRDESGVPVITNKDITVFAGGFNSTVLFTNMLDRDLKLRHTGNDAEDRWLFNVPEETLIPSGQDAFYKFWAPIEPDSAQNDYNTFIYSAEPYGLSGSVTVKPYPACMSMDEVRSIYSQLGIYPQFPSYIPEEYRYECGIHHTNSAVRYTYINDAIPENRDRTYTNYWSELPREGGIVITYNDDVNYPSENYDKFSAAAEVLPYDNYIMTYLNGNPAIIRSDYLASIVHVYLDDHKRYHVDGGLPYDELVRMAQSIMPDEPVMPPQDISISPRQATGPLELGIRELEDEYMLGEPIYFSFHARGSLPEFDAPSAVIRDLGNFGVAWHSRQQPVIGGPHIGSVDYTWHSDKNSLGEIDATDLVEGNYVLTVSLGGKHAEKFFRILGGMP